MGKNTAPPKTKPPPSDSGSDVSTDNTKKKLVSVLPSKQPSGAPRSPAKRTREANEKTDKKVEQPNKKQKPEVATPALKAAPKSDKMSAIETEKGKPTPGTKEKPSKDTKKSTTKRKTDETQRWSPADELALSRELMKDRANDAYGSSLPASRSDPYWEKLVSRFSFMEKYEKAQRIERLWEKVTRMRLRYEAINKLLKAGKTCGVYKNAHEGVLWRIWHAILGPNKATPDMLNHSYSSDDDEEDVEEEEDVSDEDDEEEDVGEEEEDGSDEDDEEEDVEEEEEDGSDEDDEEEIVSTQGKGGQSTIVGVPAQKKAISKKVVASDDDDDSNKEDFPVKVIPAVLEAVAAAVAETISATEATAVAGKHALASKSVTAKGPAPTAMDVDSEKNPAQRVAEHNGVQGGHAVMPAMIEKSVRSDAFPKASDEMCAENLALLRDMRGTCVKMVEEAKVVTEKILEETRVKTTQIVEEARVKSAQIIEELRLFVERIGTIAGQIGRTNSSHVGRWSDLSDNPFQGTGLLANGALPSGDPISLDIKWLEQSEAEQGLLFQRLQLVQEQARIQQEGIRLKLNLQKQQALAQVKQS